MIQPMEQVVHFVAEYNREVLARNYLSKSNVHTLD